MAEQVGYDSPRIEIYNEQDNVDRRREELDSINLRREVAHIKVERYKSEVRAQYNKRVKVRRFSKGELVLKRADVLKPTTKWDANCEGPFIVGEVLRGGAYRLITQDRQELPRPWNINYLKKYYV